MGFVKLARAQWDRLAAAASVLVGALCLLVGWLGVSRAVYPAQQLPYIVSGGLAGLLFVAVGATLWLSADLRDEWRHLDDLESRLEKRIEVLVADAVEARSVGPTPRTRRRSGVA